MKKIFFLSIIFCSFIINSFSQSKFLNPFKVVSANTETKKILNTQISDYIILDIDKSWMKELLTTKPSTTTIYLPQFKNRNVTLDLERNKIFSGNISVKMSDGTNGKLNDAVYYKGNVRGNSKCFVAVSIFDNELSLTYSFGNGNFCLSRLSDTINSQLNGRYILYKKNDLINNSTFSCYTKDSAINKPTNNSNRPSSSSSCVKIFLDCDYGLYIQQGNNLTNYVTSIFNETSALYASFGIDLTISNIHIWNTTDNFNSSSSATALQSFQNYYSGNFSGDVAVLCALDKGNGGLAYIASLCASFNYAYCDFNYGGTIFNCQNNLSELLAHELGHALGSNHTHWCGWNGGPIDDCNILATACNNGKPFANDGGPCSDGPTPSLYGGTIMSYCHCVNSIGVDWANGFGSQPQNAIIQFVSNSSCLSSCNQGDDCSSAIQLTSNTYCNYYSSTVTGATPSGIAIQQCNGSKSPTALDRWFSFTAQSTSETITVDPTGNTNSNSYVDAVISLYSSCGNSGFIGCFDETNPGGGGVTTTHTFAGLSPGKTYYIRVFDWGSFQPQFGNFDICVTHASCTAPQIPVVTPTGTITICHGQSTTLTVSNPCSGCTYFWSDGGTGITHDVSINGSYYAWGSNSCGISKNSKIVFVNVTNGTPAPIVTPNGPVSICQGQSTTLTVSNLCSGCTYYWSDGGTGNTHDVSINGSYYAWAVSSCGTSNNSNIISVSVTNITPTPVVTPTGPITICQGQSTTLTVSNPCSGCTYYWSDGGTGNTHNVSVNGSYYAWAVSSCGTSSNGNIVFLNVSPAVSPNVSISASPSTSVCFGQTVIFTALPINGGNNPTYQWYKNGISMPNNGNIYSTNTLSNNDVISCILNSSFGCVNSPTATSNLIVMNVRPIISPFNYITESANNICSGTSVTFISTTNVTNPFYQWRVNGINVGSNSNTFISNVLKNNDVVDCLITAPSTNCYTIYNIPSNNIIMTVMPRLTPSITISSDDIDNIICNNQPVTFTATSINGGSRPIYLWSKNGNIVATGNTYRTNTLQDADLIICTLKTSVACFTSLGATSNEIKITIPYVNPIISINQYTITNSTNRTGSTWQWYLDGQPIPNSNNYALLAAQFGTYRLTETYQTCTGISNTITISNLTPQQEIVRVYPNPFNALLLAQTQQLSVVITRIRLFTVDGKLVEVKSYNNANLVQWNLANLAAGVYLAEFSTNVGIENHKIIKQ